MHILTRVSVVTCRQVYRVELYSNRHVVGMPLLQCMGVWGWPSGAARGGLGWYACGWSRPLAYGTFVRVSKCEKRLRPRTSIPLLSCLVVIFPVWGNMIKHNLIP